MPDDADVFDLARTIGARLIPIQSESIERAGGAVACRGRVFYVPSPREAETRRRVALGLSLCVSAF